MKLQESKYSQRCSDLKGFSEGSSKGPRGGPFEPIHMVLWGSCNGPRRVPLVDFKMSSQIVHSISNHIQINYCLFKKTTNLWRNPLCMIMTRPWQSSWRYWDLSCFSTVAVGGVAHGALNAKHSLLLLRLELRTLEVPSSISSTTSSCEKPSRMSSVLSPPLRLVSSVSEPLLRSDPG